MKMIKEIIHGPGFGGIQVIKRGRTQITFISTVLGSLWGSRVYAAAEAGMTPSPVDVIGSICGLGIAVITLVNSWMKRKERSDFEKVEAAKALIPVELTDRVTKIESGQAGVNDRLLKVEGGIEDLSERLDRGVQELRYSIDTGVNRAVTEMVMVTAELRGVARTVADIEQARRDRDREERLQKILEENDGDQPEDR